MNDALLNNYDKMYVKEKVSVYHTTFLDTDGPFFLVAQLYLNKNKSHEELCEEAFVKTNTIHNAWWENEGVTPMFQGSSCRSTITGDYVQIGNKKYSCENIGLKEIE